MNTEEKEDLFKHARQLAKKMDRGAPTPNKPVVSFGNPTDITKQMRQNRFASSTQARGLSKSQIVDEARLLPKGVVQQCLMLRIVK